MEAQFINYTFLVENPEFLFQFFSINSRVDRPNSGYVFKNADWDKHPPLRDCRLKIPNEWDGGTLLMRVHPKRGGESADFVCHIPNGAGDNATLRRLGTVGGEVRAFDNGNKSLWVFDFMQ